MVHVRVPECRNEQLTNVRKPDIGEARKEPDLPFPLNWPRIPASPVFCCYVEHGPLSTGRAVGSFPALSSWSGRQFQSVHLVTLRIENNWAGPNGEEDGVVGTAVGGASKSHNEILPLAEGWVRRNLGNGTGEEVGKFRTFNIRAC